MSKEVEEADVFEMALEEDVVIVVDEAMDEDSGKI